MFAIEAKWGFIENEKGQRSLKIVGSCGIKTLCQSREQFVMKKKGKNVDIVSNLYEIRLKEYINFVCDIQGCVDTRCFKDRRFNFWHMLYMVHTF